MKKQEHIYELIITEKHHCRMLKVMQKVSFEKMACQFFSCLHYFWAFIGMNNHLEICTFLFQVFAEGMARELNMQESRIKRIFPCLDELITLHCSFLWRLRQRQRGTKYIETIGDLLVDQFTGDNARGLKDAYGQFCSQHQDAVSSFHINTYPFISLVVLLQLCKWITSSDDGVHASNVVFIHTGIFLQGYAEKWSQISSFC